MSGFGEQLKVERESRGISLEAIAEATCISVRLLQALEREDFDHLPGGVYDISFIRQYAGHLGVEDEPLVRDYKSRTRPVEKAPGIAPLHESSKEDLSSLASTFGENLRRVLRPYRDYLPKLSVTVGVALLVGAGFLHQRTSAPEREPAQREAASVPARAPVPERPPETAAKPEEPEQEAVLPASLKESVPRDDLNKRVRVVLKVVDTAWIRAKADGERVLEDIFRPGDARFIGADDKVSLLVGNAGGVTVALNGEEMPPIGGSGQVRRVVIDPSGMQVLSPKARTSDAKPKPPIRTDNSGDPPSVSAELRPPDSL